MKIDAMSLPKVHCQSCSINQLCLPVMLAEAEIEHLDSIVNRRKPYKKGEVVYHAGESLHAVYAVRSGSLISRSTLEDGTEQITGFHLPGEIVGLDAIGSSSHQTTTSALETSLLCMLPFEKLENVAAEIPGLQRQLLKVMSREIQENQELFVLLSKKNADERLAAFLMNLSGRYHQRGLSRFQFDLSMTRSDISNYLGLAVETVSRVLGRFQNDEMLVVNGKEIVITDLTKLSELAGSNCHTH